MQPKVSRFQLPGMLLFGAGATEQVGSEARRLGAQKVLIVTDQGIAATGMAEKIRDCIQQEGLEADIFADVEPEPPVESLTPCMQMAKDGKYDLVVGLGGGSAMDTAKGVAVLVKTGGSIKDYFGIGKIPRPGLPTMMLPTTAGTGSEVSMNAIFLDTEAQVKVGVVSPYLLTQVALVDPLLTLSVPPKVTAATGMDALTHAIESYTAKKATVHTEMYALEAIRLIASSIRTAVADGTNLEARHDMALGSLFAAISMANAGTGAVHALAYPLGGEFHISHGMSNALLLPYVVRFNLLGNLEKFARIAEAMGERVGHLSRRAAAERAAEACRQLALDVGIPQRMSEVGVPEEAITKMAEAAVEIRRLLDNNPRAMTLDDIIQIYQEAM